jgi:hypothetical protein
VKNWISQRVGYSLHTWFIFGCKLLISFSTDLLNDTDPNTCDRYSVVCNEISLVGHKLLYKNETKQNKIKIVNWTESSKTQTFASDTKVCVYI